jgi:peptidoglycan/LPS O-acetylase OafA/YrhL
VLGIFRNEGRQSHRIWVLGFAAPLLAGLLAAPVALRRARPAARPVLLAWLAAWALIMVLKDPVFFPKMLRWAKEDQFVSPLLCMLIAAGVTAIRPHRLRQAVTVVVVLAALALAGRDFSYHANTLWR